jgi:DNA-binding FrmR family transcriptional regulator
MLRAETEESSGPALENTTDSLAARRLQDLLARIEGQVRGIRRMLDERQQCGKILVQVMAAHAALEKVASEVVAGSIAECLLLPPEDARRILSANVGLLARI